MTSSANPLSHYYRLGLTITAALLLVAATFFSPITLTLAPLLIVLLTAVQFCFPLTILGVEVNLIHVMAMGSGLLYGPVTTGWSVVLGIILGYVIRKKGWFGLHQRPNDSDLHPLDAGAAIGLQVIPLVLGLLLAHWGGGIAAEPDRLLIWPKPFVPLLLFSLLQSALILGYFLTIFRPGAGLRALLKENRRNFLYLALLQITPMPFVAIACFAFPSLKASTVATLGIIPTVLGVFIYAFSQARNNLERRLQELSTLNQISRVLRSTLDLGNLLTVIHVQVTQLLKVDNFYVALYDLNEKRLWYPLAVKHGKRQSWSPRPLNVDRLTDRVINEGNHILVAPKTEAGLERVGLPSSEENPYAWMGVPLITSHRAIGCLAVFSTDAETEFTQADLDLLIILSGQVSVAIENALLYEQTQRRAAQLESLNRINSLITASLNPQEVFEQVCQAVAQVGSCEHSAIFLVDPEKGKVSLAHAYGMSDQFSQASKAFPVTQNNRMRSMRTGSPVLAPSLAAMTMDSDFVELLMSEGIQAFGEFPLTTPDGQIGFLAVYFKALHTFRNEEVEVLQTLASQAALAVSNARLYAHVDRALSRRVNQLSILEAVGRELSGAISSERLFEMILDYALTFTNSSWGELSLLNAQTRNLQVKASRGYAESRTEFSMRDGLVGRAASTQQIVYVGDVRMDPAYIDVANGQVCSHLSVPMIHEERVLGVISLESDNPESYSVNDRAFVSQLATQAAVAVVNAELYSETQRRLREQSILYLVSTRLVSNPDLESVLQTLARSLEATLKPTSIGVYFWEETQGIYKSGYNLQVPERPDCILPEDIYYADLETYHTSLLKTGPLRISARRGRELVGDCSDCQALVFPLIASKQRLGMVLIHVPKKQVVQEEELQLLRAIVSQVSLSLHNALLFSDVARGRDRMAAVLNSVGEGILMLDGSGYILLHNEFIQSITGLPKEQILYRRITSLPEKALQAIGYTVPQAEDLVENLNTDSPALSQKVTYHLADVKPDMVIDRTTAPVLDQDDRVIGRIIVLRDVTEEHKMAEERELITNTLVHDLRSPVSAVMSGIDVLEEIIPVEVRDEIMDQALKVAHNGSARVLGLIESLLDIARMQSGRVELSLAPVNLHDLAATLLGELSAQANEYHVTVKNSVPESLPAVCADQGKITRVMNNLLDNALKFTPAQGVVEVSATLQSQAGQVELRISDTGPGIPEEFREKVFERFAQVPGSRGRRRGSGLGLTFCRMAVEAHGGRIWVENISAPQTGSVFTLLLPISGPTPTM